MLNEFKTFISRGNVLDLAVGVIIGAAFGRVVNALVEGVLMPPLGLLLGRVDFSSLFVVLDRTKLALVAPGTTLSLAKAKELAIPVIAYGQFINEIISFLIVALAVFLIVKQANRFKRAEAAPATPMKECTFCASSIPAKATRCPNCTSAL